MVPSGMIVPLKTAPVKSAPFVIELRKLVPVKSVNRSFACVRLALVIEAPANTVSVKFAWVRFAPPKLLLRKNPFVQIELVRLTLRRLAPRRNVELRLVP